MTAHLFNIGLPNTSPWWQQNLQRGVITTGYDNHHPDEPTYDVMENAAMFSVNDANRVHYDKQLLNLRSDAGHPQNLLFKTGNGQSTCFERYEPARHGIWIIEAGPCKPKFIAREILSSAVERATAQARQAEAQVQALEDMPDERTRVLRLVVLREGRKEFRDGLVHAYGGRCAISGCTVLDILEAAHIHSYRGPYTDETSNGLLLRADIHTLFDKGLLWIEDDYMVRTSPRLEGSEYQSFAGTRLRDTHHGAR